MSSTWDIIFLFNHSQVLIHFIAIYIALHLQVQVTIQDEDFSIYRGDNASHVAHLHDIQQQSWFSFLPWKEKSVSISPFSPSCTGVYTKSNYSLRLDVRRKSAFAILTITSVSK